MVSLSYCMQQRVARRDTISLCNQKINKDKCWRLSARDDSGSTSSRANTVASVFTDRDLVNQTDWTMPSPVKRNPIVHKLVAGQQTLQESLQQAARNRAADGLPPLMATSVLCHPVAPRVPLPPVAVKATRPVGRPPFLVHLPKKARGRPPLVRTAAAPASEPAAGSGATAVTGDQSAPVAEPSVAAAAAAGPPEKPTKGTYNRWTHEEKQFAAQAVLMFKGDFTAATLYLVANFNATFKNLVRSTLT